MAKYIGFPFKFRHGNAEVFGINYVGSSKEKQANRKRKMLNKNN